MVEDSTGSDVFEVSFGKVDITPEITSTLRADRMLNPFMAGYGIEGRRSAEPDKSVYARCSILWQHAAPNVIVTADVLAFGGAMHKRIRAGVARLGVVSSSFILTATHTHNGPVLIEKLDPCIAYNLTADAINAVRVYSEWLVEVIVALVRDTLAAERQPCTIDYQVADVDLAYNRRGLPSVETKVPVLTARGPSGQPLLVLFSYGCHPVTSASERFSADYPGEAIGLIEMKTSAFAHFILGPAGDQNPRADVREYVGAVLGERVVDKVASAGRTLSAPILTSFSWVDLPFDIDFTPTSIERMKQVYEARRQRGGTRRRHADIMIGKINQWLATGTGIDPTISLPLQVWRFGPLPDLRVALTGGELVSGYAVILRNRYERDAEGILVGGYANEVPCYIPSDQILLRGPSYEGGMELGSEGVAGDSLMLYGCGPGHFRPGPGGVEEKLLGALGAILE